MWYVITFIAGAWVGFAIAALCAASKKADECAEKLEHMNNKKEE